MTTEKAFEWNMATLKCGSLLCRLTYILAVGIVVSTSAVAADFTVPAGSPTTLTAEQAATIYDKVYVNDDLTIDGAYCTGLTNLSSITLGTSATKPVTVVITNGAKWIADRGQKVTFAGKGGTIVVSQPQAPAYGWGSTYDVPGIGNVYTNAFGTMGYYNDVEIGANAEAPGGVMDIARLLSNGTVSFRNVKNLNPNVDARILFQGGTHWVLADSIKKERFTVANNAKVILESIDGNPISLRSVSQSHKLFSGSGTLETRGNGDFVMWHVTGDATRRTITLSHDEGGEIVWSHKGRTVLTGGGLWKIGNDNILPYGVHNGPVVFCNDVWPDASTTIDLNGRTVTVNGLLTDGTYGNYSLVTNSSETIAMLRLNMPVDTNLSAVLAANLAPDAISNIRLQKIGAGTLKLGNTTLPKVRSFEVAEGMLFANATTSGGNLVAKDGSVMFLKSPLFGSTMANGFCPDTFVVDADAGKAVLSNVWQRTLTVRSGTASIENTSVNIPPAERSWRPAASVIGAVTVEGGVLDIVSGRLASTNISIVSGASLRIRGGVGITNRVEFYTSALSDRYYRFIFKESQYKQSFGLNHLYLRMNDGTRTFSRASDSTPVAYELNETASSASDLAEGQYMYSCPNGITYHEYEHTNGSCVFTRRGLSERSGLGGVIINENNGLSLADSNTWVTLTIRLRADVALPLLGYHLANDWVVDKLCAWEVQASADGTTWRTVDERRKSDIYTYSTAGSSDPDHEGFNLFNGEEPFQWRSLASDNVFNCEGSVQVDEGAVLDLSCVPDANISIKSLTFDAASGGGTIVKFHPAANGTLNITGIEGRIPSRYTIPVAFPDVIDVSRLAAWNVTINGNPSPRTTLEWSNGVLTAVTPRRIIISFR